MPPPLPALASQESLWRQLFGWLIQVCGRPLMASVVKYVRGCVSCLDSVGLTSLFGQLRDGLIF